MTSVQVKNVNKLQHSLQLACGCLQQLVQLDLGEDASVLLGYVSYTIFFSYILSYVPLSTGIWSNYGKIHQLHRSQNMHVVIYHGNKSHAGMLE